MVGETTSVTGTIASGITTANGLSYDDPNELSTGSYDYSASASQYDMAADSNGDYASMSFSPGMSIKQVTKQYNFILKMLSTYNKMIQPNIGESGVVIDVNLNQIKTVNEQAGIMTTAVYFKVLWTDPRLTWNKTEQGFSNVLIPASSLWLPDLFVVNTADANGFINVPAQSLAVVSNKGFIYLALSVSLNTRCNMNIQMFPYDAQTCSIIIGAWQSDDSRFSFRGNNTVFGFPQYVPNPLWKLKSVKIVNIKSVSRFGKQMEGNDLQFTLRIERLPMIYLLNNLFPCLILNVIILAVFFIPYAPQVAISKN